MSSEEAVAYSELRRGRTEPDVEVSDARIMSQFGYMDEQLANLHKMVSELTMLIEPILLPELSDANGIKEPGVAAPIASSVSLTIDDLNRKISRLQGRIMDVMKRVQL